MLAAPAAAQAPDAADCGRQCLPAYRWSTAAARFRDTLGSGDWTFRWLLGLTEISFAIAAFGWQVLVFMIDQAGSLDLLTPLFGFMDEVVAVVGTALWNGGIGPMVAAIGVCGFVLHAVRKDRPNLGAVVRLVVCLGLMLLMTNAAVNSPGDGSTPGSPSWVAQQLNETSLLGGSVTGESLSDIDSGPLTWDADTPACDAYIDELHRRWQAGSTNESAAAGLLSTTSTLWESTHMRLWEIAQFGTANQQGTRVGCHLLEINAESPLVGADGQSDLAQAAVGYPGQAPSYGVFAGIPDGEDGDANDPGSYRDPDFVDKDSLMRTMTAWAWCGNRRDQWVMSQQWEEMTAHHDEPTVADACEDWWTTGDNKAGPSGDGDGLFLLAEGEGTREANDFTNSLHGKSGPTGLLAGLAAIATVIAFGWTFGVLAVGALAAQLGLGVAAMAFIVLLLYWALPGDRSYSMLTVGRWVVGLMVARVGYGLAIGVLAGLVNVTSAIGASLFGETADGPLAVLEVVWMMFHPLVVLWLIKRVARRVGMDHLLSPRGALHAGLQVARGEAAWGALLGQQPMMYAFAGTSGRYGRGMGGRGGMGQLGRGGRYGRGAMGGRGLRGRGGHGMYGGMGMVQSTEKGDLRWAAGKLRDPRRTARQAWQGTKRLLGRPQREIAADGSTREAWFRPGRDGPEAYRRVQRQRQRDGTLVETWSERRHGGRWEQTRRVELKPDPASPDGDYAETRYSWGDGAWAFDGHGTRSKDVVAKAGFPDPAGTPSPGQGDHGSPSPPQPARRPRGANPDSRPPPNRRRGWIEPVAEEDPNWVNNPPGRPGGHWGDDRAYR